LLNLLKKSFVARWVNIQFGGLIFAIAHKLYFIQPKNVSKSPSTKIHEYLTDKHDGKLNIKQNL
jgi:hypothetical protein